MKRTLLTAILLAALLPAASASAAPDRTGSVSLQSTEFSWKGVAQAAVNLTYYDSATGPGACSKDPRSFCESTLVKVDDTYTGNKRLSVVLDGFTASDFDLRVYRSDANGARMTYEGAPTGDGNGPLGAVVKTFNGDFERKEVAGVKAGSHWLVDIVYFMALPTETHDVKVTLK